MPDKLLNFAPNTNIASSTGQPMLRYQPNRNMPRKAILAILLAALISNATYSITEQDAANEGEAVGIVFGHLKEMDVLKFMCERKSPETAKLVSTAVNEWMVRNEHLVTNLVTDLDNTPAPEKEQLFEIAKQVSNYMIISFNKLEKTEKDKICLSLASRLNSDSYQKEYPVAYQLISK